MSVRPQRKTSSRARRRPRRPGRPENRPGRRDVRETLLEVAGRLFTQRGVSDVSLRELARTAEITPAMVHYYFGDKQGLYDALLERALVRLLERVRAIVDDDPAEGDDRIGSLLRALMGALSAEPWIPSLIIREVLADEGRFRERFIQEYASQVARIVPEIVGREMVARRFRSDLDPQLAFVSLLGMTAWPFAARPVLERVLGLRYDAAFAERLARHTRRLFLEGVRRPGAEP